MAEQKKSFWNSLVGKIFKMTLIVSLTGFTLLWLAIPHMVRSRQSPANICINNLREIDAAANQFALEHKLAIGDPINFPKDITPYINLGRPGNIPSCPSGGIYYVGKVGATPTCSLGTNVIPDHVLP